jgi:hypothetical protein
MAFNGLKIYLWWGGGKFICGQGKSLEYRVQVLSFQVNMDNIFLISGCERLKEIQFSPDTSSKARALKLFLFSWSSYPTLHSI